MTDAFAKATGHNSGTSQTEQDEARKFLFDRHGAWARIAASLRARRHRRAGPYREAEKQTVTRRRSDGGA